MRVAVILGLLVLVSAGLARDPAKPDAPKPGEYTGPRIDNGVAVLLDDNIQPLIGAMIAQVGVNNVAQTLEVERNDVFAGLESLKQTGQELHIAKLPGWDFKFVEKPKAANEFRYMRFAWKKSDAGSILLAFPQNGNWGGKRYAAGPYALGNTGLKVAEAAPKEWTIVTRDVFKDFGELHCSGILFSSCSTGTSHWDLLLLGKTVEDLDIYTETTIGKGKPKEALTGAIRQAAWEDLMSEDRNKASLAFRKFLPVAAEQVSFIRDHIPKAAAPDTDLQKRVQQLITQLGGDDFDGRLKAQVELEKLGTKAGPQLKAELNGENAETDYRARMLLKKIGYVAEDVSPGQQRAARIARLLERANTPDARQLLAKLSAGEFGADYPTEANAALQRMKK